MAELKSCPFCGGEAELRSYIDHGGKKSWTVRCKNMCVVTCGHRDEQGRWRPTLRKEAIEAWNRRTKIETNIYDKEETYPSCTVQVLTNTATGEVSVGWWENGGKEDGT